MKLITILGARPQFIKAAILSRHIRETNEITEKIIHTGQHYDTNMSEIFFKELNIPEPDINLGIGGGTHGKNTGRMIEKIETHLIQESPDAVLVYGDTDSTLAGAIATTKLNIPLIHIEAGLRSHNRKMPEEINRILTDHISDYLITPSQNASQNLKKEGITEEKIHQYGDIMYDAVLYYTQLAQEKSTILKRLSLTKEEYLLVTIHRAENVDTIERLKEIIEALNECGKKVIFPIHPRTKQKIKKAELRFNKNVIVTEPVGYLDMINLEKNASLIITDSGGVQKEAYYHKTPCLTLRTETEWTELIETGWNRLCEIEKKTILAQITAATTKGSNTKLYGDGTTAKKILTKLKGISN